MEPSTTNIRQLEKGLLSNPEVAAKLGFSVASSSYAIKTPNRTGAYELPSSKTNVKYSALPLAILPLSDCVCN